MAYPGGDGPSTVSVTSPSDGRTVEFRVARSADGTVDVTTDESDVAFSVRSAEEARA